MAELIDIYDENRKKTGIQLERNTKLVKGQFMMYVLALIEDESGRYLVTRRALDKKWAAGQWEIPGGGAIAGEESIDTVCREVKEETGLTINPDEAAVIYSYKNEDLPSGDNYFVDIYRVRLSYDLEDVHVDPHEVIDVRKASLEEITSLYETEGFLHYKRLLEALQ